MKSIEYLKMKNEKQLFRVVLLPVCTCKRLQRSQFLFRERFNLSAGHLLGVEREAPAAPVAPGGAFAVAWRNYIRACFKKGYMYTLSCAPSSLLYIADNKTLAGKEGRAYEEEAVGRKMAVVFFERLPGPGRLVQRVHRGTIGMHQTLLTIAELLLSIGGGPVLPADPARTAAQTENLLESSYQDLELLRYDCAVEPAAPAGVHVYSLGDETLAEVAMGADASPDQRTRMTLARALQRNGELLDGETLRGAWDKTLPQLTARTRHLFPAPAAPPGPAARPRARPKRGGR